MTVLLVLAKAPVAGRAKTRLCPPATPEGAARIAAAALLDTMVTVRAVAGVRLVVAWTGDLAIAELADEVRCALRDVEVFPQRGRPFGRRIAAAHADLAALAPGEPVLQISTDTPQASAQQLDAAIALLAAPGVDGVLGPASDGGWWAMGLRDPRLAALMADVTTSQTDTGARTLGALRRGGLRVMPLVELTDVDTVADAFTVASQAPSGRFAAQLAAELAPATWAGVT